VRHDIYIRRQNRRETPQRRQVALTTVQTDDSSAAVEKCFVTGWCHAVRSWWQTIPQVIKQLVNLRC